MKHTTAIAGCGILAVLALIVSVSMAGLPSEQKASDGTSIHARTVEVTPANSRPARPECSPAEAQDHEVSWYSTNGGGVPSASPGYRAIGSVGQSAIGYTTGVNYEAGIGYWYGTRWSGEVCYCPYPSDFDADGFLTALDLGQLIDILFAGGEDVQDATCPVSRADFDCDGFATALDLGGLIDHLFAGGDGPCDPC